MKIGYIFIISGLLISGSVLGQRNRILNQPTYDKTELHFGFSLGVSNYSFIPEYYSDAASRDSILGIESPLSKGYAIGIISDLRLSKRLNLRFIPTLSYAQRKLVYLIEHQNGEIERITQAVESTYVDFPISIKYKSDRYFNGRAYVLGGVKYSIDMASQEKVDDKNLIKLKPSDLYWDIGVGCDFYFEFFKFSPEIKFSMGLRNILVDDQSIYTRGIKNLNSRCLLISFNFE